MLYRFNIMIIQFPIESAQSPKRIPRGISCQSKHERSECLLGKLIRPFIGQATAVRSRHFSDLVSKPGPISQATTNTLGYSLYHQRCIRVFSGFASLKLQYSQRIKR